MLVNGDFESGLDPWQTAGIVDTFTTTSRNGDGTGGSVVHFQDRYVVNDGIQQSLGTPEALPCFHGSNYYLRITADVKLYDPATGLGITACRNDRQHNYMTYCPRALLWVRKDNEARDAYGFEIHDANMVWNAQGWNTFDVIFQVPEFYGENLNCLLTWKGSQPNYAYLLDNVVLRRMEAHQIPGGVHIWTPQPLDCEDNIFLNDDGEYQSPYGWQAFGHWSADFNITVVEDGSGSGPDGTGYALVALDRTRPQQQGLGQWFNARQTTCFGGWNFYFRIEMDVRLYDQSTGLGIATCSPQDSTTVECREHISRHGHMFKHPAYVLRVIAFSSHSRSPPPPLPPPFLPTIQLLNCPKLHMTVQRQGENTASSHFYDEDITTTWDPNGWNHLDMIVAMHPLEYDPPINYLRINVLGGPDNSVLMMDHARARRITYSQIPSGHPVYSLTQGTPVMDGPVKTCKSTGDPHFTTFGGVKFDYHDNGWNLLYEKGDLRVEGHHTELPGGSVATLNDAVRVTYLGTAYVFVNGTEPTGDAYFDPNKDEFVFPSNPSAKVVVTSRYFFRGSHIYSTFVTTSETTNAEGLCVDKNPETEAIVAAGDPVIVYDPNGITEEQAQAECSEVEGTATFEDCVMDLRLAVSAITSTMDESEGDPLQVARTFVTASAEVESVERSLEGTAEEEAREEFAVLEAAVNGDPTIVGLNRQVFHFEGRSDAWYANLAIEGKLHWNMKFKRFSSCPYQEDMFVTGLGISLSAEQNQEGAELPQTIEIKVNEESFMPGCELSPCLGDGSLEILVGGESITAPGDYSFGAKRHGFRVAAYNTFASCSRRWHDYVEPVDDQEDSNRLLATTKSPLDMLFASASNGNLLDSDDCLSWVSKRQHNDDFFLQKGAWSTIFIETPYVSFHIEYRQSDGDHGSCPHHSLDAWMSKMSRAIRAEEWRGILGETREPMFNEATGKQVISERESLLSGKNDEDYEVAGPYSIDFKARKKSWKDMVRISRIGSSVNRKMSSAHERIRREEYFVGHEAIMRLTN